MVDRPVGSQDRIMEQLHRSWMIADYDEAVDEYPDGYAEDMDAYAADLRYSAMKDGDVE